MVPRADGHLIVGATVEERGFDTAVTAGGVHELLREAYRALPDIAELELEEMVAGLRPGTPDNAPLIGHGAADGLLLATGHFRNGILLAPATADAVAAMVAGEELDPALEVGRHGQVRGGCGEMRVALNGDAVSFPTRRRSRTPLPRPVPTRGGAGSPPPWTARWCPRRNGPRARFGKGRTWRS